MIFERLREITDPALRREPLWVADLEQHIIDCYAEIDRSTALLRECVEALQGHVSEAKRRGKFGEFEGPLGESSNAALTRARAFLEGK